VAANTNCQWWIQNGAAEMAPLTGYIPAPPVLITPATGLIGIPEQTQNGLRLRVLLNPNILIGRTVQLQAAPGSSVNDINQYRYGVDLQSSPINLLLAKSNTKLNAAGLYYVMRAEHSGDTRGQPWYTDLTCLAVDASLGLSQVQNAAIGVVTEAPGYPIPQY
jgi:hypothetical protein